MSRINLKGTGYIRVFCDNPNCEETIDVCRNFPFGTVTEYLDIYEWTVIQKGLKRFDFCCNKCLDRGMRGKAR